MLFVSYDKKVQVLMSDKKPQYGVVVSTGDVGQLVRSHRKNKQLTLENTAGLANLSVRFLSEFERGKDTAEIGKVLKALRILGLEVSIRPRGYSENTSAQEASISSDD